MFKMDTLPNMIVNKYYNSLNAFNQNCGMNNNCLNVIQWNVRGMNNFEKFDELIYFVNECKIDIDVIIVGESWLKKENICVYNIPGYRAFFLMP